MSNYQSPEEYHFACWLEELKQAEMIIDYTYEPEPFVLLDPVDITYLKQLKTKTKPVTVRLADKVIYTTDFRIEWNPLLSDGVLTWNEQNTYTTLPPFYVSSDNISYVEVKPDFDQNNMTRAARIKIGWVQNKYGIQVKLWRTKDYDTTFYPESMLLTPQGSDKRKKINGELVLLRNHVPTIKTMLCNIVHQTTGSECV